MLAKIYQQTNFCQQTLIVRGQAGNAVCVALILLHLQRWHLLKETLAQILEMPQHRVVLYRTLLQLQIHVTPVNRHYGLNFAILKETN